MSTRDAQNVVVTGGVVGNLATTSYGPRKTNKTTASQRPMSWVKRMVVVQMDGDQSPTLTADFANGNIGTIPKGSLITNIHAYGHADSTGASSIAVIFVDALANTASTITLTPGAGLWDTDATPVTSTLAETQVTGTITAGDRATVIVEYITAEEGDGGVLSKTGPVSSEVA